MRRTAAVWGEEYITEKVETKAGWQFPSPEEDWMRGYPQELEDFVAAISERRSRCGRAPGPRGGRGDLRGLSLGGDGRRVELSRP